MKISSPSIPYPVEQEPKSPSHAGAPRKQPDMKMTISVTAAVTTVEDVETRIYYHPEHLGQMAP
ncbi:hypothetical protein T03_3827 [Trichinella britovi]|uniref:Uncharacterized protein n=1 Tax=Trichinella britovi TaxID=45882 RepID=A0A0V1CME6_TRIBR|nr:hypothetical protein T03_3827 [Trichinella britovi]